MVSVIFIYHWFDHGWTSEFWTNAFTCSIINLIYCLTQCQLQTSKLWLLCKSSFKNNRYINLIYKAIMREHAWTLRQYSNCKLTILKARLERAPWEVIFPITWLKGNWKKTNYTVKAIFFVYKRREDNIIL